MAEDQSAPQGVALVIGAGDATGGAIARRFAREGLVACVVRRSAEKLQPLVEQIEAEGGRAIGFASDARKEEQVVELVEKIEREVGPIEVLVFNIGANVPCSILDETARKYFKIWEMACFSLPARQRACVVRPVSPHSQGPSTPCAPWRRAWRASSARSMSTLPMSWSTAPSTPSSSARISRTATRPAAKTASSSQNTLPTTTGICIRNHETPGRTSSICALGVNTGKRAPVVPPMRAA
jgi:NAD(P)-dependent dehydrogenase (short-subunit alcohol dehydrogenase family)